MTIILLQFYLTYTGMDPWLGLILYTSFFIALLLSTILGMDLRGMRWSIYHRMIGKRVVLKRIPKRWISKVRWIAPFEGFTYDVRNEDWLLEGSEAVVESIYASRTRCQLKMAGGIS